MDGLVALPRRNPGEPLGDVSNRRGSCLAPTPGRSCAVRNPAFHRPVLGRPAHRRTRPGRPAQLARTLARRGGGRREVSSLGSLPSQRPPYEGRLSRASRVAPCGWRDSRERAGHDPSESRPTVAVFLKGDLSVQGCRWWDSWRATVGDQPSDWRTYRRTGAKLPANQPFLGGLENRYPSLGGSRVRIPPPPPSMWVCAEPPRPTRPARPWVTETTPAPSPSATAMAALACVCRPPALDELGH